MNRRKPSFTSLVAFGLIVLPIVYVLSYAPYIRLRFGSPPIRDGFIWLNLDDPYAGQIRHPFYGPVEWLIDRTPAKEPLVSWADFCGSDDKIRRDSDLRTALAEHQDAASADSHH